MAYTNPHAPACFWYDVTEKYGAPNVKWCEETLCAVISEPANTWSNLVYILIPFLIWREARATGSRNMLTYPVAIFIMGLGSFIYHASNFYPTQILDFVGMFLFTGWCLGMNLIRLGKLPEKSLQLFIFGYSLVLTGVMHVMYISTVKFQSLILFAGFAIIATEYLAKAESRKWFLASIALLVIAFGFSISDGTRFWCDPSGHVLQGHAIWHVVAGIAMWTIWRHYHALGRRAQTR